MEWSREAGPYVVIDMHAAPGGQTGTNIDDSWGYPWLYYDSSEAQQLLISIWKRMAARYRDSDTVLGYDLLNEPIPHFPELKKYNPQLEPLYKRIVASIREVDKNHIVILGKAQQYVDFRETHRVPIWMSESGENTVDHAISCVARQESH